MQSEPSAVKRCTKCGEARPLTEFFARRDSADGKNTQCRSCHKARHAAWRRANPEARRLYDAAWELRSQEEVRGEARDRPGGAPRPDRAPISVFGMWRRMRGPWPPRRLLQTA